MSRLILIYLGFFFSFCTFASETLVIISPHRKSVEQEFIPLFEAHCKQKYGQDINVEWLDQGGASDDLRYILMRFEKNPASIGIDIMWGGGEHPFYELDRLHLLDPYHLPTALRTEIPDFLNGIP